MAEAGVPHECSCFKRPCFPRRHALLLKGRKGLGKLAFASYLAKTRLCQNCSEEGEACGSCASCRWFEQGGHPDFRLVQPEALWASSAISGTSYGY